MSALQRRVVALTVAISALDGFDVLSVTFAAPAITRAWGIGKAEMGIVLSAGLAGMAIGSLLIAPLADVVGRRRMVLASLALMGLGSLLCAYADGMLVLTIMRVVTGLGVGTAVPVISPLAAEFSNERRRPLAMAAMAMGYPAGGLLGGLLASELLAAFDWRAVFLAGFAASALLLPVIAAALPESPAFLAASGRSDALARYNAVLARCGFEPVARLPIAGERPQRGYSAVFATGHVGKALQLTIVNCLNASVAYYLLSWMPQMVGDAGFSPSDASLVSAVANLAGLAGGILLGAVGTRSTLPRLSAVTLLGMACATLGFGWTPPALAFLMIAGAICGFFLFATTAGLFATFALAFPPESRASGTGFVMGIGRVASAVAPMLAGALFASGLGRLEVSTIFAGCALIASITLLRMRIPHYEQ